MNLTMYTLIGKVKLVMVLAKVDIIYLIIVGVLSLDYLDKTCYNKKFCLINWRLKTFRIIYILLAFLFRIISKLDKNKPMLIPLI